MKLYFIKGASVSIDRLTIGCSRAGSLSNPTPVSDIRQMWQAAVDAGVRGFDTANIYAQGDSERNLAKLLAANQTRQLEIITKAGFMHGRKAEIIRLTKPFLKPLVRLRRANDMVKKVRSGVDQQNFNPAYLESCVRGSLRRLGVDSLPGFVLHDPGVDALERPELARFLFGLKQSAVATQIGISIADDTSLVAAIEFGAIDILQVPVTCYEKIRGSSIASAIRSRGTRLFVRQILNRPDGERRGLELAVAELLQDEIVASVIVGVSQKDHLNAILKVFKK